MIKDSWKNYENDDERNTTEDYMIDHSRLTEFGSLMCEKLVEISIATRLNTPPEIITELLNDSINCVLANCQSVETDE